MKPFDSNSVKKSETPKSTAKKAGNPATRPKISETVSETYASATNDADIDTTDTDSSGISNNSGVRSAAVETNTGLETDNTESSTEFEVASKKAVIGAADKPLSKKVKTKAVSKPNTRSASKRKSAGLGLSVDQIDKSEGTAAEAVETESPSALDTSTDTGDSQSSLLSDKLTLPDGTVLDPNISANSSFSVTHTHPVNQSSDRIAIFIDGSNLFYAASHLNIEVDYRRLLSSLVRGRRLLRAYFYTGVDPQNEKQRGFLLWLNRHGHRVVSKELTHLPDGSRKANMHVEMAVDMMRISEYCPNIVLLGGDGNLTYVLRVLSQRGTFIEVVSLQPMTSDSLIDLADSYTDLANLREDIKR